MPGMPFAQDVRDRFVELLCRGVDAQAAALSVGASARTGGYWAKAAGVTLFRGRGGGMVLDALPAEEAPFERGRFLSFAERFVIQIGKRNQWSQARIAAEIDRHPSVVSRELAARSSPDGFYYAARAEVLARAARRRPKLPKLARPEFASTVRAIETWMDDGWSPKLIASMLTRLCPKTERVSHETIYRALYVQTRGMLRQDLARKLSLGRTRRVPRDGSSRRRARYADAFTISQRPAEVADRAVPGHWEGDLIIGASGRSAIGTLVERSTRFVILLHLPGRHTADEVATAMIREMSRLPDHLRKSVTWDRGIEMADYKRIQLELEAPVFFCDPQSPWQRGTNENTNRLLRFWFEKGTDLAAHTANDLAHVAATLNARPRPTLDYQTPAQRLEELLTRAA